MNTNSSLARIAYFSMEIAVDPKIPSYAGGLGVLAGDTLRSAADLGLPMVGVTLAYRSGYFKQSFDGEGRQIEARDPIPEAALKPLPFRVTVDIESRRVTVRARVYDIGAEYKIPVLFLDTDCPENTPADRVLCDSLYGGDHADRLKQEIVLGVGGVRMLRAAGFSRIKCYHLNEGHAALLTAELLREEIQGSETGMYERSLLESVRRRCVFTTHTPIAAGHDRFDRAMVRAIVGDSLPLTTEIHVKDEHIDLTQSAIRSSRAVNAVSARHAEVCRSMFADVEIKSITNGVHHATWIAPPMAELFNRVCPGWRADPQCLRLALRAQSADFSAARAACKLRMCEFVARSAGARLSPDVFTIGVARRATGYKRLDLILRNPDHIAAIAARWGGLHIVFAGKAHPRDATGHEVIERLNRFARHGCGEVKIAMIPDYDISSAAMLVSGCDLWVNTPIAPLEASGTSGMKAALNGVPSLSVADGWWPEGCIEGLTGWSIPARQDDAQARDDADAASLYATLDRSILPLYIQDRDQWTRIGMHAVALNGTYFNTHRMVREYSERMYAEALRG
ncbi:MAG: alpha-glucan family phosphorylase [Phycisphaerales bacterium]